MKNIIENMRGEGSENQFQLTERAIWMSAREFGSKQITITTHSDDGYGISIDQSPSSIMNAFDQYGKGSFTVWFSTEPTMEIYGSPSAMARDDVWDWEDMLAAGRKNVEAPDTITISGKTYQYDEQFNDKADADARVAGIRSNGEMNAQVRRKAGQYVIYTRAKAPKKVKPAKVPKAKKAKKAPAKKTAKKAKKAPKAKQPKAKKPSKAKKA